MGDPFEIGVRRRVAGDQYSDSIDVVAGQDATNAHTLDSAEARKLHRSNFKYHMAFVDGTSEWLRRNTFETEHAYLERSQKEIAHAAAELDGRETAQDYENMKIVQADRGIREAMARGYYNTYQNLGWCGRADSIVCYTTVSCTHGCILVLIG